MIVFERIQKAEQSVQARRALQFHPPLEDRLFENARRHLSHRVEVRDALPSEGCGDKPGKRACGREQDRETCAIVLCQKLVRDGDDSFRLLASIEPDEEVRLTLDLRLVDSFENLRFSERLFP